MKNFTSKFDSSMAFKCCKFLNLGSYQDFYIIPNAEVDTKSERSDLLAIVVSTPENNGSNSSLTVLLDDHGVVNSMSNNEMFLPANSEYAHFLSVPGTKTINKRYIDFMTQEFGRLYLAKEVRSRRNDIESNNNLKNIFFTSIKNVLHMQEKIEREIKAIPLEEPVPEALKEKYAQILMLSGRGRIGLKELEKKDAYLEEMFNFANKKARNIENKVRNIENKEKPKPSGTEQNILEK